MFTPTKIDNKEIDTRNQSALILNSNDEGIEPEQTPLFEESERGYFQGKSERGFFQDFSEEKAQSTSTGQVHHLATSVEPLQVAETIKKLCFEPLDYHICFSIKL